MGATTSIEWTATVNADGSVTPGATWNCIRGCSRVSPGCLNCYAETIAARFSDPGQPFHLFAARTPQPHWTGKVELVEKHLADPMKWRAPRRIFVNSMSDLFHEALPDEAIDRVFAVMALCKQHQFQILTKRPERMLAYFSQERPEILDNLFLTDKVPHGWQSHIRFVQRDGLQNWPLSNVWLGVSAENQETADARIPLLLQTPAAVRFVSYEPALGPIDFTRLRVMSTWMNALASAGPDGTPLRRLDWTICGGESGPAARPAHPSWFRSARDQCTRANVPFFFKQWGEFQHGSIEFGGLRDYVVLNDGRYCKEDDLGDFHKKNPDVCGDRWSAMQPEAMGRIGKKAAGALLDGVEWKQFPKE